MKPFDDSIPVEIEPSYAALISMLRQAPATPQGAGPNVAPVVPALQDQEAAELPPPPSQSGPIATPIALPQAGAMTTPLSPDFKGAGRPTSATRNGNAGKQAAIEVAVGAGVASSHASVVGAGQPPGSGGSGRGRRPRLTRRLLAILLVVLTLLLLLAGIALASPPGQNLIGYVFNSTPTTTVTITPNYPTVSDSFVVTAVTGTPNPADRQVQARVVSYTSPQQLASANAAGSIPGANATGTLTFANIGNGVQIPGGILTALDGVQISFGSFFLPFGSVNIQGTAVDQGVSGNIPALAINGPCCESSSIAVKNSTAFSGGRDPVPNSIITQHDITTASNNLISQLTPSAQAALQQKLQPGEQAVSSSLNCRTNVVANHNVGDQAKTVTVTGTATCTEVVYDQKGAITLATSALTAEAAKNPGTAYALAGKVVTTITSATVINKQNTVSVVIQAQGVWVYQFTDAIKTTIRNKIAREAEDQAQAYINGTQGVMSATISISSGTTMPANAGDVTINIVQISGLNGSPTPTTSPTTVPPGTTPTVAPGLTPTNGLGQGNGATVTPTSILGGS